jgi:hypothetical protein
MIAATITGQKEDRACVNELISETEEGSIHFYVHLSCEAAIERSFLSEIAINRSENDSLLHKK